MQKSKEEMRKMEQYAEAVASALAGNQEGYDFLYQSTYQKKYFIAKNIWEMTWMRRMFYRMPMCRHLQN